VSLHNPSILDFIRAYIAENEPDALLALTGARFFEQVMWLEELPSALRNPDLRGAAVQALQRCYGSDSTAWEQARAGRSSETGWRRISVDLALRLSAVLTLARRNPLYLEHLQDWIAERLSELLHQWRNGQGSIDSAVDLVVTRSKDQAGDVDDEIVVALKLLIRRSATTIRDYERLWTLVVHAPSIFDPGEVDVVRDEFQEFASNYLSEYSFDEPWSALSDLSELASQMEVALDADELAQAKDIARAREDAEEARADEMMEAGYGQRRGPEAPEMGGDARIDAMFGRLTDL
jgi:hypothetical protein